ncbi:MerR family transcriptional regulator [Alloyangia pacifica]|uniref:Transcriptional regulator, MerR family n=1 Tax=Alloyangia pacifica TaxID=311180 RepID=A0A1I6SU86_9RHOB|nr:MerR family DNA-binding transcriptional regulator [Alloyangia pacifica]SDG87951.1 transcriptional regulator, MerR family [Alloyangia pacifica]SFS80438.1 transcriptional regulator, MerR family [Alloyangia pacifica]
MDKLFSISDLSKELGVTPRTIRFYEEQGLVLPQRVGTNRVYTSRDRGRLILILRGKRLGFTLKDIREYLDLYDADPTQREQIDALLVKVRQRIHELDEQFETLRVTLKELREIEQMSLDALERHENAAARTASRTS